MKQNKSLGIFFVCIGYLIGGLLFIPFTIGAFGSYNPSVPTSNNLMQLGVLMLVLVVIPLVLAYCIWQGYRLAWAGGILFAAFNILLYLVTFASLNIKLSTGVVVGSSPIGPLGYTIAYGVVYLGTYLIAVIDIILNIGLIYFLTRKRTKEYFGL